MLFLTLELVTLLLRHGYIQKGQEVYGLMGQLHQAHLGFISKVLMNYGATIMGEQL
jgi:hypothetical protein